MNKISLTLLSSALLLSPVLHAAEKVDQSAALESGAKLNIKIQRGEVKIRSWDKAEVAIKGKLDELSEGLVFGQQGGSFVIEDKLPKSYNSRDKDGSKLEIFLPATVNMKLKAFPPIMTCKDWRVRSARPMSVVISRARISKAICN